MSTNLTELDFELIATFLEKQLALKDVLINKLQDEEIPCLSNTIRYGQSDFEKLIIDKKNDSKCADDATTKYCELYQKNNSTSSRIKEYILSKLDEFKESSENLTNIKNDISLKASNMTVENLMTHLDIIVEEKEKMKKRAENLKILIKQEVIIDSLFEKQKNLAINLSQICSKVIDMETKLNNEKLSTAMQREELNSVVNRYENFKSQCEEKIKKFEFDSDQLMTEINNQEILNGVLEMENAQFERNLKIPLNHQYLPPQTNPTSSFKKPSSIHQNITQPGSQFNTNGEKIYDNYPYSVNNIDSQRFHNLHKHLSQMNTKVSNISDYSKSYLPEGMPKSSDNDVIFNRRLPSLNLGGENVSSMLPGNMASNLLYDKSKVESEISSNRSYRLNSIEQNKNYSLEKSKLADDKEIQQEKITPVLTIEPRHISARNIASEFGPEGLNFRNNVGYPVTLVPKSIEEDSSKVRYNYYYDNNLDEKKIDNIHGIDQTKQNIKNLTSISILSLDKNQEYVNNSSHMHSNAPHMHINNAAIVNNKITTSHIQLNTYSNNYIHAEIKSSSEPSNIQCPHSMNHQSLTNITGFKSLIPIRLVSEQKVNDSNINERRAASYITSILDPLVAKNDFIPKSESDFNSLIISTVSQLPREINLLRHNDISDNKIFMNNESSQGLSDGNSFLINNQLLRMESPRIPGSINRLPYASNSLKSQGGLPKSPVITKQPRTPSKFSSNTETSLLPSAKQIATPIYNCQSNDIMRQGNIEVSRIANKDSLDQGNKYTVQLSPNLSLVNHGPVKGSMLIGGGGQYSPKFTPPRFNSFGPTQNIQVAQIRPK